MEVADPVLVLLDEVDLDPILVDPGPGLVLRLVELVACSLEVADPVLGFDLILVELEVVLAVLVVAAGPGVGLNPLDAEVLKGVAIVGHSLVVTNVGHGLVLSSVVGVAMEEVADVGLGLVAGAVVGVVVDGVAVAGLRLVLGSAPLVLGTWRINLHDVGLCQGTLCTCALHYCAIVVGLLQSGID